MIGIDGQRAVGMDGRSAAGVSLVHSVAVVQRIP